MRGFDLQSLIRPSGEFNINFEVSRAVGKHGVSGIRMCNVHNYCAFVIALFLGNLNVKMFIDHYSF